MTLRNEPRTRAVERPSADHTADRPGHAAGLQHHAYVGSARWCAAATELAGTASRLGREGRLVAVADALAVGHHRKQGPPRCGLTQRSCRIFQNVRGSRRRSRTQPNLEDLRFLELRRSVCSSYPLARATSLATSRGAALSPPRSRSRRPRPRTTSRSRTRAPARRSSPGSVAQVGSGARRSFFTANCVFRSHLDTGSGATWTPVPAALGHWFRRLGHLFRPLGQ